MSKILKETTHLWLLSYDNCDEIRELFDWACIVEIPVKYSINKAIDKTELLIFPKELSNIINKLDEKIVQNTMF